MSNPNEGGPVASNPDVRTERVKREALMERLTQLLQEARVHEEHKNNLYEIELISSAEAVRSPQDIAKSYETANKVLSKAGINVKLEVEA